jgi:UDP-N-acetylmuramate dehydrogenase
MRIEHDVSLKSLNTFGLPAVARTLVRVSSESEVRRLIDDPQLGLAPKLVLGGGSNVVFIRDVEPVVIKMEIMGRRIVEERADCWIVEAGAGENWHDFVAWTLEQGLGGLENMALIPGTVGAAPVQNIGAYGVELADRFESVDNIDFMTGRTLVLGAQTCRFGYRDSIFKRELAGKSVITRVRLRLPKPWIPVLGYLDLEQIGRAHV